MNFAFQVYFSKENQNNDFGKAQQNEGKTPIVADKHLNDATVMVIDEVIFQNVCPSIHLNVGATLT